MATLSIIGVIIALVVMVLMCFKNCSIFLTAIVCSVIVCLFSSMNIYDGLLTNYMEGFANFVKQWFLLFSIGTIFGKLMQITDAASSVGLFITRLFGRKFSLIALTLAIGALNYSGINGFVAIFVCYPIMLSVFKDLNIPKRFLCGIYFFGVGTWANMGFGSPSGLNVVSTGTMNVPLSAAPVVSLSIQATIIVVGSIWMLSMVKRAQTNGETFQLGGMEWQEIDETNLPNPLLSFIPLIVCVLCVNIKIGGENVFKTEVGILLGCIACLLIFFKRIKWNQLMGDIAEAFKNSLTMTASTAAVTGFAAVVMAAPAYAAIVNAVLNVPGPKLLSLAIAISVLCACTGTATGSVSAILPTLGPVYTGMGLDPAIVARISAATAVGLDSVPHNGTCVAVIGSISRETYKTAYFPVFALSVVTPLIGVAVGIAVSYLFFI